MLTIVDVSDGLILAGELDADAAPQLLGALHRRRSHGGALSVQMDSVSRVDTAGVDALRHCARLRHDDGNELIARRPPTELVAILTRLGCPHELTIRPFRRLSLPSCPGHASRYHSPLLRDATDSTPCRRP